MIVLGSFFLFVWGFFFPSLSGPSQSSYNEEGQAHQEGEKEPWIVLEVKRPGVSELKYETETIQGSESVAKNSHSLDLCSQQT